MNTMARKNKVGLDYFPFEVNFFVDLKVRRLIRKHGGQSVSIYTYLLCLIYESGYFIRWNDDMPFIIHESVGIEESLITDVLNTCLEVDLFDYDMFEKENILTSKGIQERYSYVNKQCKRKAFVSEFNLIDSEEMQQSKENKSKENKINLEFIEYDFSESFYKWIEYKKEINDSYKIQRTIEAAYKKLKDYSNNNPDFAMHIVDRSIANQWRGLFPEDNPNIIKKFDKPIIHDVKPKNNELQ